MADPNPIIEQRPPPSAPAPTPHGTYERSVKIDDVGGASESDPKPAAPFVNPDPKSIHKF